MAYLKDAEPGTYDCIIVDSSDPIGETSLVQGAAISAPRPLQAGRERKSMSGCLIG